MFLSHINLSFLSVMYYQTFSLKRKVFWRLRAKPHISMVTTKQKHTNYPISVKTTHVHIYFQNKRCITAAWCVYLCFFIIRIPRRMKLITQTAVLGKYVLHLRLVILDTMTTRTCVVLKITSYRIIPKTTDFNKTKNDCKKLSTHNERHKCVPRLKGFTQSM